MKRLHFNRLCAVLLSAVLLISAGGITPAADKAEKAGFVSRLSFDIDDGTVVKAIVVFDEEGGIDYAKRARLPNVSTAAAKVKSGQSAVTRLITDSYDVELCYSYSALFSGIAVKTSYGTLKALERFDGVERIYLANSYSAPVTQTGPVTKATDAAECLGFNASTSDGTGAVIAVLDTGISTGHEAFDESLVPEGAALSKQAIQAIISAEGLGGAYLNKKLPYVFDYCDMDTNISSSDTHGTNVASIAAGNNGDDFNGIAPNAQILGMKIFDSYGTTDSTIYFAAMEEAYLLGADVINMSLGAVNGFSFDYELETYLYGNIFEKLKNEGVFVFCAAGNEYSQGHREFVQNFAASKYNVDAVTADYADYGVINSPASYEHAIAVGSADASIYTANTITVNGTVWEYYDSAADSEHSFYSAFSGRTLNYVMIPGVGRAEDYEGLSLNGKIAVVARGDITFNEKHIAAANAGAAAMICYNNAPDTFAMDITEYSIPCISVEKDALDSFVTASSLTVNTEAVTVNSAKNMQMSDFSSRGVTPDLLIKPEITGVGGYVLCASNNSNGYTVSNGTSMATPVISGVFACVKCYYRNGFSHLYENEKELYDLVYDSVMSSATLLRNGNAVPYSPRQQGVGVPEFSKISNAKAVFDTPIISLGDDPEKTGSFTVKTAIKNISGEELRLSLGDAYILCDAHTTLDGVCYNTLKSRELTASVTATVKNSIFDGQSYTLPAGQEYAELTFTVVLDSDDREYLSAYPNGGFVEGYIYLDVNGTENSIKQTFMGFYGDWRAAPVFEAYDWGEVINAQIAAKNNGENYEDYTALLNTNVGYNEAYLALRSELQGILGDNLYDWVSYDYDRMAFPTAECVGNCMADNIIFYPSLLRNVRHIIMTVANAETGEVYYVDDTEYAIKNFYDFESGGFAQGTYFTWDGSYYDSRGNIKYAEDGTRVKISFETQLDYEGAELITEREYFVYIDNSAPVFVYSWDADSKQLTVRAKDGRYISNIFVYTGEEYEVMHKQLAITDSTPNEYGEWVLDLSDTNVSSHSQFYLEVQDYATNYDRVAITTADSTTNIYDLKGDANLDGEVNSLDAATVLKYDVGLIYLSEKNLLMGDVNASGVVDNLDAAQILRYDAFGYWAV